MWDHVPSFPIDAVSLSVFNMEEQDALCHIEPLLVECAQENRPPAAYRDASTRQVSQWLRETRGVLRNPVLEYLRLPTRPDREHIHYSGDMTLAQEANAVLDLQDGEPRATRFVPTRHSRVRQPMPEHALPPARGHSC